MLRKLTVTLSLLTLASACGGGEGNGNSNEPIITEDGGADAETRQDASETVSSEDAGADATTSEMDGATEDAGSTPDAADTVDAAEDASSTPDAMVDAATTPDAATPPDAATTPDAAVPQVVFSLTVKRGSAAVAQVPVYFHSADGTLVSSHTTDANGRVETTTLPGMATAVVANYDGAAPGYFTFTQIAQGDHPVLELAAAPNAQTRPGYLVTPKQLAVAPGNASDVLMWGGNGGCATAKATAPIGSNPPVALLWPVDCPTSQTNLIVAAVAVPQGLQFAHVQAPLFGEQPSSVALGDWAPAGEFSFNLTNIPGQTAGSAGAAYTSGAFQMPSPSTNGFSKAQALSNWTTKFLVPTSLPDGYVVGTTLASGATNQHLYALNVRAASAPLSIDMAQAPAQASALTLTDLASGRPTAQWTNGSGGSAVDGTVLRLFWYRNPTAQNQRGEILGTWTVIAPAEAASFKVPQFASTPSFVSTTTVRRYVSRYSSSVEQGYRDFLKEPIRPLPEIGIEPLARRVPAVGLFQAYTFDPN